MPLLLLAGLAWLAAMPAHVSLDWDEGFNLMKARLVRDGFALYDPIWSDQPPLMTYLLAGWMKLFGTSPMAGRTLVLVITCAGLWAGARMMRQLAGGVSDVAFIFFALTGWRFLKYSVAAMIGLPAIAVGLLALWPLARHVRRPHWIWPLLSGVVFAASMQIKLFTAILLPMVAILLLVQRRRAGLRAALDGLIWLAGWSAAFFAIRHYMGFDSSQMIGTHLADDVGGLTRLWNNASTMAEILGKNFPLVLVSTLALVEAFRTRDRRYILPAVWLGTAFASLMFAHPLWEHHGTMLSLPMAGVAAIFVADLRTQQRTWPSIAAAVLAAALLWRVIDRSLDRESASKIDPRTLELMKQHAAQTRWVFADAPLYAAVADLRCIPELTVLSSKRISRGFGEEQLLQTLRRYSPEQVVLRRYTDRDMILGPTFWIWLEHNYELVHQRGTSERLYFRRAIPPAPAG